MPGSTQLIPPANPRAPRRQSRIKLQVDVHSLALDVQTLSLMLSDLRGRLSELEKKSNTDKITDADRGMLNKFGHDVWIAVACTRFRRHRVRCFNGTGGGSWRGGSLRGSSSLRQCA
jgi:hypothetical protein